MYALRLTTRDPTFNLALEEQLLSTLQADHPGWLLLWQNSPSIIVGRHQNTAAEVNTAFVREQNLPVVRRISGGGAVYHDPGNLNFSFLLPLRPGLPVPGFATFLLPITRVLAKLGVKASLSGRNDLVTPRGKCSGSAQFRSTSAILHHGTLLINVNMDNLARALTGDPEKFRSKGLASVRSRVANLAPQFGFPENGSAAETATAVNKVSEAVLDHFKLLPLVPDPTLEVAAERLAEQKYRSWEWNYGCSPGFTERHAKVFPWGRMECFLDIREGGIRNCRFYGDFFSQDDLATLEAALRGIPNHPKQLSKALRALPLTRWFPECQPEEFAAFLAGTSR